MQCTKKYTYKRNRYTQTELLIFSRMKIIRVHSFFQPFDLYAEIRSTHVSVYFLFLSGPLNLRRPVCFPRWRPRRSSFLSPPVAALVHSPSHQRKREREREMHGDLETPSPLAPSCAAASPAPLLPSLALHLFFSFSGFPIV